MFNKKYVKKVESFNGNILTFFRVNNLTSINHIQMGVQ